MKSLAFIALILGLAGCASGPFDYDNMCIMEQGYVGQDRQYHRQYVNTTSCIKNKELNRHENRRQ